LEEAHVRALTHFPKLATLGLGGTGLTDSSLELIGSMKNLEVLVLANTAITDEGVLKLKNLTRLRVLDLKGTRVTADALAELKQALPKAEISWEQPPERFSAAKLEEIRKKSRKVTQILDPTDIPDGWSKSSLDPNKLLGFFKQLKLKEGLVLRAYQFNEEQNGESAIWALPIDAEFPDPADCPRLENTGIKTPKPFDALDDVMQAIAGDDSAATYLAASVFRRELQSFGVLWHGMTWNTHTILDKEPVFDELAVEDDEIFRRQPLSDTADWKWNEDRPRDWSPQVKVEKDRVTVTFYSYSALYTEGFYRHTDIYRRGQFRARTEDKQIAVGMGGIAP